MNTGLLCRSLALLTLLVLAACGSPLAPKSPPAPNSVEVVRRLRRSTVTFVRSDGDKFASYAGGVWLDRHHIITVFHGLGAPEEDMAAPGSEKAMLGTTLRFKTYPEVAASFRPRLFAVNGHPAVVKAVDKIADLAVLRSSVDVDHDYADLCLDGLSAGDVVHVVGHPRGNSFTYLRGVVSAARLSIGPYGGPSVPMYQVAAPIWFGSSGGGVFSDQGELAGIVSTLGDEKEVGWAIQDRRIAQFLLDNGIELER